MVLSKASAIRLGETKDLPSEPISKQALKRMYRQTKLVSQIISFIWRWGYDETDSDKSAVAIQLAKYFTDPTIPANKNETVSIDSKLKELFSAVPTEDLCPDLQSPAYLLSVVFHKDFKQLPDDSFPIFTKYEIAEEEPDQGYSFYVDIERFHGAMLDSSKNEPSLFTMIVPYPPRPQLGNLTVTEQYLEEWIDNRNEKEYTSKNAYIPLSCC